jgi:PPOX class probable FMN-dependent enzyme
MFEPTVTSEAELRELIPEPLPRGWAKEIPALDEHCRAFIARSPFFVFATSGTRVTPRGGPAGFVRVLDAGHLAFADYTGNRRADSHRDILADPRVQLTFFVPRFGETLRVDGTACLTTDPALLPALATGGDRPPRLAVGVTVERAFLHCAKALRRSGLWEPERWPDLDGLPSAAQMLKDHVADERSLEKVQSDLDESYANRLW